MSARGLPAAANLPPELTAVWQSAMPAMLLDDGFVLSAVNAACTTLLAEPAAELLGTDPVQLQPLEDREAGRRSSSWRISSIT